MYSHLSCYIVNCVTNADMYMNEHVSAAGMCVVNTELW